MRKQYIIDFRLTCDHWIERSDKGSHQEGLVKFGDRKVGKENKIDRKTQDGPNQVCTA